MENLTDSNVENKSIASPIGPYFIIIVMIIGFIGNLLVVASVCMFRSLRIVPNYYIASLAVVDFLVSVIIMPFGLYVEINRGQWKLGSNLCTSWIVLDVMLSTASILHLCVISKDRYRAITKPVQYAFHRTNKAATTRIFGVFLLSGLVSMPALIVTSADEDTCGLSENPVYTVVSSLVSFYVPCIITLVVYYKIYRAATAMLRHPTIGVVVPRVQSPNDTPTTSRHNVIIPSNSESSNEQNHDHQSLQQQSSEEENGTQTSRNERQTSRISVTRERKAARTIGIVVCVFVSCWLPFFILHVTSAFCIGCNIKRELYSVLTWLGWSNSVINPIIYTVFNKEFRTAFKRILRCRFH